MDRAIINKMTIIGLGLIGSSIGHACKKHGLVKEIIGYDQDPRTREIAMEIGFVDGVADSIGKAVLDSDVVVLCVSVGVMAEVGKSVIPHLKQGAILTDVGSVKRSVIDSIMPSIPEGIHFVPGHPIAGTEKSGPRAGFASLFDGRWAILTPVEETDKDAVSLISSLWEGFGAKVDIMDANHHDKVLGITSHLPHLIAFTIVNTASELEDDLKSEVIKYSAGGFRDFTRIAASDPVMWRDIFLNNQDASLDLLQRFIEDLTGLQKAIRRGNGDVLEDMFTRTKAIRQEVIDVKQDKCSVLKQEEENIEAYKGA